MKRIRAIVAFTILASTFMAQTLAAQTIDRTQRPVADPAPEIAFPPYQTLLLDNGLKVFLVHDPRPLVTMRLLVRGGNAVVGEKTGLGDAVADLMTKGAGGMSAQEFAEQIDFVGGNIGASSSEDAISISASGLKKHIGKITELFANVVLRPTYPADELAKYQALQIDGLKASKKQSDFIADYAVRKVLFGDAPFARMPSEKSINALTREDILNYHATYVKPENATLAIVGDLTASEVRALLNEKFATWKSTGKPVKLESGGVKVGKQKVVLVDRPTSVQSAIRIVGAGPDYTSSDRTRASLLSSILGGGTGLGNRLASNLRETHGWTYSPYSYFTTNLFGGSFVAAADVSNNVTDSAIVQMIFEIERLTKENVPDEELTLNVQSAVGTYLMSLANADRTATRVQSIDFYSLPTDHFDKLVEIYTSTTPSQLMAIAKKYFQKEKMAVVVVGKASDVQESLKQFGDITLWNEDLQPVKGMETAEAGVSADQVWNSMLDAMGGKDVLRKVKSLSIEGKMELSAGGQKIPGIYKMVQAYPRKEYVELTAQMGPQTMTLFQQFTTEESAAQIQQGQPIPMGDDEVQKQIASTHILQEAWLDALGGSVELKGIKEVDGKSCYVILLKREGADDQSYYIDRTTYLPYEIVAGESDIKFTGWGKVDAGITQPSGLIIGMGPSELVVNDLTYTVNGTVDEKIFQAK